LQITEQLKTIADQYKMKVYIAKTEFMGICGDDSEWVKSVFDYKIIEQAAEFKYIG
jgi:hypothetical protein